MDRKDEWIKIHHSEVWCAVEARTKKFGDCVNGVPSFRLQLLCTSSFCGPNQSVWNFGGRTVWHKVSQKQEGKSYRASIVLVFCFHFLLPSDLLRLCSGTTLLMKMLGHDRCTKCPYTYPSLKILLTSNKYLYISSFTHVRYFAPCRR